ncbi:hypothetical protein GX586_05805, partial [bacterium]|nr:hypothetical protein [bacterium]
GRHFVLPYFEQVEVRQCVQIPPGKIGVVTSKVGKEPSGSRILAEDDEKGIWRRVLTPGSHRLNPYGYTVEIQDAVVITPGYVGFVTGKLGTPTTNRFSRAGEQGAREQILQPGIYYINPYELRVMAVEVGINQVTFAPPGGEPFARSTVAADAVDLFFEEGQTKAQRAPRAAPVARQVGKSSMNWLYDSRSREQKEEADRIIASNVQRQIAQQGVSEVKSVRDEKAKQKTAPDAITFPSSDAFIISLDATIEWELLPAYVPEVMVEFGDVTAIEDKIIIPQSQSIGRLQGSTFKAKDFLLGEHREQFQAVFRNTLSSICREKNVVIHSAFIRNIMLPESLLTPIRERYISVEKEKTAKIQEVTRKSAAQLQREKSLIVQRRQEVEAQTLALVNLVQADQNLIAEQMDATTRKLVAEKQVEIAQLDAARAVALGEAQADVKRMQGEAEAQGFALKVKAFGDAQSYTRYQVARLLPADLRVNIVHTGDGTLWTDLEKTAGTVSAGTILSGKQQPPPRPAAK